jgi:hypothetical protein
VSAPPPLFPALPISLDAQIREVEREIEMRKRVYPRWVEAGRLTEQKAAAGLFAMHCVLDTLRTVRDGKDSRR